MNKIKKTLFAIAFIGLCGSTNAQFSNTGGGSSTGTANSPLTLHAGYQSYTLSANGNSYSDDGFYVGGSYDVQASESIFVTPGLYFAYVEDIMDLRVPVLLNFRLNMDQIGFGVFAGPTITFGLAGDAYDSNYGGMDRFDLGISFGGQLSFDKFSLEVGYTLGLLERVSGSDIKSNHFFVGVGCAL